MVKKNTTISIDSKIKEQASKIIKEKFGTNVSYYIETIFKKLIKENKDKEVK